MKITQNKHLVIKCHRCGTSKGFEDKGLFADWKFKVHTLESSLTVWFHNEECFEFWKQVNHVDNITTHEYSEEYGLTKTMKDELRE